MRNKVLLMKNRRPVFKQISLDPLLDFNDMFYYTTERAEDDRIGIVVRFDNSFVQVDETYLSSIEREGIEDYFRNTRDTFLSKIANSTCPSLFDIRVYEELGMDSEPLINKRKEFLLDQSLEMMEVEYSLLRGETITGHDLVKLCFFKKIQIPQDIFGVLGWSTPHITKDKLFFKNEVSYDLKKDTVLFVVKIRKKLTRVRINNRFVKCEDVLGNAVYWIHGCSFEMLKEGEKCCGVYPNPDYKNCSSDTYGKKFICELRSRYYSLGSIKRAFDFLADAKAWGREEYQKIASKDEI